ncbi:MAG: thioredoxin TrxC [Pseudomonadales bacterium]
MNWVNIVCPHCFVKNRVPEERLSDGPSCGKCHQTLFEGKPLVVNEQQFTRMIEGNDIPVIVDFWASWCGPCKMFAPVYEQAAEKLEPGMRLLKVETDENPEVATKYRIQSIPTLAIFSGGKEFTRQAGAMPLSRFMDWATANGKAA